MQSEVIFEEKPAEAIQPASVLLKSNEPRSVDYFSFFDAEYCSVGQQEKDL